MLSTVTKRGQTAIPSEIRKKYHITPNTYLEWLDDGNTVTIIPISSDPISSFRGKSRKGNLTISLLKTRQEDRKLEETLNGRHR